MSVYNGCCCSTGWMTVSILAHIAACKDQHNRTKENACEQPAEVKPKDEKKKKGTCIYSFADL